MKSVSLLLVCLWVSYAGTVWPACAQSTPLKGVVWQVPTGYLQAQEDLERMHRMGIEAIRTGIVRDRRILAMADSLGFQFFQELPIAYLPAARLLDTLASARSLLSEVIDRARQHPSARHFGVARNSDTSSRFACAYFEALGRFVRARAPAGSRLYYVTMFTEDDACASEVDFVLLDVLDAPDPVALLARWQAAQGAEAGIATMGYRVDGAGTGGYRTPRSEAAQARYLETNVRRVLGMEQRAPVALFVHRWRDVRVERRIRVTDLIDPYADRHGLWTPSGQARRAQEVVAGFYTGRQQVFAYSPGKEPPSSGSWIIALGWACLLLLSILYAALPLFRGMARRYFFAHAFYQQAVRGGRDVQPGASAALLVLWSLGAGIVGTVLFDAWARSASFHVLAGWMPENTWLVMRTMLRQPPVATLVLGGLYAVLIGLGMLALMVLAWRGRRISVAQVLMLVAWPHWTMVVLITLALLATTLPVAYSMVGALMVMGFWILFAGAGLVRVLHDWAQVTGVSMIRGLLAGIAVMVLAVTAGAIWVYSSDTAPELAFLWHHVVYR